MTVQQTRQSAAVNVRVENYKTVKEFVYALTKNLGEVKLSQPSGR